MGQDWEEHLDEVHGSACKVLFVDLNSGDKDVCFKIVH
jgi:hypothetical protein